MNGFPGRPGDASGCSPRLARQMETSRGHTTRRLYRHSLLLVMCKGIGGVQTPHPTANVLIKVFRINLISNSYMSHKVHRKTCSPSPSLNQTQNHSVHQQQKLLLHQGQTRQSLLPSLSRPTYQFLPCHQLHHQHLPAFFAPLSTFFFCVQIPLALLPPCWSIQYLLLSFIVPCSLFLILGFIE